MIMDTLILQLSVEILCLLVFIVFIIDFEVFTGILFKS